MKVYEAIFDGIWPVPHGLIIAANNDDEAMAIAKKTVTHTEVKEVRELDTTEPRVLFYESGNY